MSARILPFPRAAMRRPRVPTGRKVCRIVSSPGRDPRVPQARIARLEPTTPHKGHPGA